MIDTRLDVVAELVESEERFRDLRKALKSLERIDADTITGHILAYSSLKPSEKAVVRRNLDPAKESEKKIQLVLQLRTFIRALPNVRNALMEDGGAQSSMLGTIVKILGDERLKAIEGEISDTLNEQALVVGRPVLLLLPPTSAFCSQSADLTSFGLTFKSL